MYNWVFIKKNHWFQGLFHILFWGLSFVVFLYIFKIGVRPSKIDIVYTLLFHLFIVPATYINLKLLIPKLGKSLSWFTFAVFNIITITAFSWLCMQFFARWSNMLLPDYFFISYFSFLQVFVIFAVYIFISTLLKLSKTWFLVNQLQHDLLRADQERVEKEKELFELEARALRAQMNPHFIFNCMNSIKALIQNDEKQSSIDYLTTFSKLIRTLFQNSDKRQITLFDEVETCKLYLQLEAMRLNGKLRYDVEVDKAIDLKSIFVPALIIQPFIENAIWHGIVPKSEGTINFVVKSDGEDVTCIVDDNGIGREMSKQCKSSLQPMHESKGIQLSKSRLELEKLLNDSFASIETIDKYNEEKPEGTKVIIIFKMQ